MKTKWNKVSTETLINYKDNAATKIYSGPPIKSLLSILAILIGLTACNGGTTSNPNAPQSTIVTEQADIQIDAQTRTPASAQISLSSDLKSITSLTQSASGNNCFSIVNTANGKNYTITQNSQQYYSTATVNFILKNTCVTPQSMSGLGIAVTGLNINTKPASINYIDQGQNNPYLTLSYTISGSNINITTSTPACNGAYCSWAEVPAGGVSSFSINAFANTAISSLTLASISISGNNPPPPVTPGSLAINVNTVALAPICPTTAKCKIELNVFDPTGSIIQKINVNPSVNPNYTITYNNLLIGNYTIGINTNSYPNGSGNSISYTSNPTRGIVTVNSGTTTNASVKFQYTAPIQVGSLTIKTGIIAEASTFSNIGNLSGVATNNTTHISYPFNLGLNSSTTLSNLPVGNSYSITLQGIADPATGIYYQVAAANAIIVAKTTSSINLNFIKVTQTQNSVLFNVIGAPSNQVIKFAGSNTTFKYNADTLTNGTYKFLTHEAAVAVTLIVPEGYTLSYTPSVITPTVTTFNATYTKTNPLPTTGLSTLNGEIIDNNGTVIALKGINWFGFNNSDMLNGMWNYNGLSGDFETTVRRLKALGFNAIRLPFVFANLNGAVQNTYQYSSLSPATTSQLIANLTNPSYSISGKILPALTYTSGQTYANQYLPANTVMARFVYVINFFAKNGFYVLIDNHTEDNSIVTNQTTWVANWKILASNIINGMPASSSKLVMYDLRNEPDAIGYDWSKMGPIYLATMDAINSVTNNNNLFFIEGSGQGGISANWGDGFATNSTVISQNGLSNPNSFFQSLASRPYLNQVVLSPHVYPPSVTGAGTNFNGNGLYNRLSTSFGNLSKTGYCISGVCHRYPIAIGEFGSNFTLNNDLLFFKSFANYLNNNNDAVDGLHNPINNWFYWDYNPNSSDTGGIVANDWITIQWTKINYLSNGSISGSSTNPNGLGLIPWYH